METTRLTYAQELDLLLRSFRRYYVARLLAETGGNISAAARLAGMERSNFRRLMQSTPPESIGNHCSGG